MGEEDIEKGVALLRKELDIPIDARKGFLQGKLSKEEYDEVIKRYEKDPTPIKLTKDEMQLKPANSQPPMVPTGGSERSHSFLRTILISVNASLAASIGAGFIMAKFREKKEMARKLEVEENIRREKEEMQNRLQNVERESVKMSEKFVRQEDLDRIFENRMKNANGQDDKKFHLNLRNKHRAQPPEESKTKTFMSNETLSQEKLQESLGRMKREIINEVKAMQDVFAREQRQMLEKHTSEIKGLLQSNMTEIFDLLKQKEFSIRGSPRQQVAQDQFEAINIRDKADENEQFEAPQKTTFPEFLINSQKEPLKNINLSSLSPHGAELNEALIQNPLEIHQNNENPRIEVVKVEPVENLFESRQLPNPKEEMKQEIPPMNAEKPVQFVPEESKAPLTQSKSPNAIQPVESHNAPKGLNPEEVRGYIREFVNGYEDIAAKKKAVGILLMRFKGVVQNLKKSAQTDLNTGNPDWNNSIVKNPQYESLLENLKLQKTPTKIIITQDKREMAETAHDELNEIKKNLESEKANLP